jgi:hypothetical protein
MSNSRRGKQRRLKHDDWHYFDQLPPEIKAALWDGPQEWSSYDILNTYKLALGMYPPPTAITKVLAVIEIWNRYEILKNGQTGDIASMQRYSKCSTTSPPPVPISQPEKLGSTTPAGASSSSSPPSSSPRWVPGTSVPTRVVLPSAER